MSIISREARKYEDSSFFHVIVQGINKEYIFKEEIFKNKYLEHINKFSKELNINIIAYCIMDNHAHILIMSKDIVNLSKFMQKTNSMYAKYYNYLKERVGYVFKDRFLSEPIDNKRYFIKCIKYIHLNPVKAKIVTNIRDYKYSSYNYYLKKENIEKNKLLKELLTNEDYKEICDCRECNKKFLDIEQERNIEENIKYGIQEYIKIKKYKIYEIFISRKILKELIRYLKIEHKIKYTETQKFFEIKRGTMEGLKTYK